MAVKTLPAIADALLAAGRLDEAIALRANRLEGREAAWPRHARILARWREEPRLVARSYAREGALRGEAKGPLADDAAEADIADIAVATFDPAAATSTGSSAAAADLIDAEVVDEDPEKTL